MLGHARRDAKHGVRCGGASGAVCCGITMNPNPHTQLPPGVHVLVHDWLSANAVVLWDDAGTASVVDTGHVTRARATCDGVASALAGRRLRRIVNTHLHSDHCGGNARLQRELGAGADCAIVVPAGELPGAGAWEQPESGVAQAGQQAEPFRADCGYAAGDTLWMGGLPWQAHAAGGHDDHALMLFQPDARVLISGDALWEHGFGVLFPEIDGGDGFAAQRDTLRRIERLAPRLVIPGHGPVFAQPGAALERAHARLDGFEADPPRHAAHALRVLLKFHVMEQARPPTREALSGWFASTAMVRRAVRRFWPGQAESAVFEQTLDALARVGALLPRGERVADPDLH